jgi:hypothetical protein
LDPPDGLIRFQIIHHKKLNEPLKSLLTYLADGTDLRRPLSSAKIAADSASPHRKGKLEGHLCDIGFQHLCRCFLLLPQLLPLFRWSPPLRNGRKLLLARQDGFGDIKRTVTGAKFIDICVSVVAGADEIQVLGLIA